MAQTVGRRESPHTRENQRKQISGPFRPGAGPFPQGGRASPPPPGGGGRADHGEIQKKLARPPRGGVTHALSNSLLPKGRYPS